MTPPLGHWLLLGATVHLWCGGCSGAPCTDDSTTIVVAAVTGETPEGYELTATWDDATPTTVSCPGASSGPVTCTATGVSLAAAPEQLSITVKARGYRTAVHDGAGLCANGPARTVIELASLPAADSTEDYVTGFTQQNGAAEFQRLAVNVAGESGTSYVVKFLITDVDTEPQVYFQNTNKHPLHYGFARQVLGMAISQEEFVSTTYSGEDRTRLAGSLVAYPGRATMSEALGDEATAPYTLEFFPSDDLSPRLALLAYRIIEQRLGHLPWTGTSERLYYLPPTVTHEQAVANAERAFRSLNALWLTRAELFGSVTEQYLNPGTGCGTLHRLTPEQLATTPLSYKDLLVLTRLPNELPLVGGTITEELQTPLAHVNVAARARGTPNMALLEAGADPRIAPMVGRLVCLTVEAGGFSLREVTLAEAQELWDSLIPAAPFVPAADLDTTELQSFADIGFHQAVQVGAKAANLAELSHLLSDHAPDGFAVPFSWYHQHLATTEVTATSCTAAAEACAGSDRTPEACNAAEQICTTAATDNLSLQAYVDRLLSSESFITDTAVADASLAGLRHLITTAPLNSELADRLDDEAQRRWGNERKLRLRSSTNAEDLENFSGAGLYSSYSAQLDTDTPPSHQVKFVWASVWNFPAFQERSFWNIAHRAVKMGVAVHPSYPHEYCNGVVITQSITNPAIDGHYVNVQHGEHSVTNPDNGLLPEVYTAMPAGSDVLVLRDRYSSLTPGYPVMTHAQIVELYSLSQQVLEHFAPMYQTSSSNLALDLEFKRVPPAQHLVIKQVRPYFAR